MPWPRVFAREEDEVRLADTTVDGANETTVILPSPQTRQYVEDYTDGTTLFPWQDMPIFIVSTVDSDLKKLLKMRITAAGGKVVRRLDNARIIVIPHDPEASVVNALREIKSVQDSSASIVKPHWVFRTFFDGIAEDFETSSLPLKWKNLATAVADLGDDELRLDLMIALEREGAVLVPFDDCKACVLPSRHAYLQEPPAAYEHLRFFSPETVFEYLGIRRPIKQMRPELVRRRVPQPAPPQPAPAQPARTPSRQPDRTPARQSAPAAHRRQEFSTEDRDYLARYIANACPDERGRTSKNLYVNLVGGTVQRPTDSWEWATRHPAEGWRQHYRTYKRKPWRDDTVLHDLIEHYVEAGIDSNLHTEEERRHLGKKANYNHRGRGGASSPSSPASTLKQKRRRWLDSEDGMRRQPRRGTKKKSRPQPTSSSASDDEFIDEQLSD
ncbi:uncharacterized protein CcaverHIS019_0305580 [Cutaneotrichosporon cavernicola]|uniref:BRCT domain-containing protein n=1 Tax=Cutaneotrichosporon cavernicola TaxID=279322 RepID=A0AA48L2T6_9TREE|nr:uncharacterized protein CcaverHIS019_0305580 [Cutaneotrichosporon cavernicola]BEI90488.1 hypothetical protein CcaverHIS019_0305580 [Cutaneotrichosporon cavernicola]BEI98261.1 hypothetical protein CcaverHIS631_0305600 [Cutaneotrichosporon cavernicola]BEJ06036.1 hypothetical protein CcaverHIS641_0305580 [Cutaneotrichosporon cavernicola]